jgi:hypothetical protein
MKRVGLPRVKSKLMLAILVLLTAISLQGCVLDPIIEGLSELGLTEQDRQRMLSEDIKHFNDALYWGSSTEALSFALPESRQDLSNSLREHSRDERIVESKIESLDFQPGAYEAQASVVVKYYRVPVYLVTERVEEQKWKFALSEGWKLVSRKLAADG